MEVFTDTEKNSYLFFSKWPVTKENTWYAFIFKNIYM